MRKLRREPLSEQATRVLWKQTVKIVQAGSSAPSRSKRAKARRDEAKRLWDQKAVKTFEEVRTTLKNMASGVERCMYCESNEGTDIEHFWPLGRAPCRAFDWSNYLLSCSACNSNHKGYRFPRKHGQPLLINPTEDDPLDHLVLTPTGKFVPITEKGETSIPVFGLDRGPLERSRVIAWVAVDSLIIRYANACARGDSSLALGTQKALCEYPQVSVFAALLRVAEGMGAEDFISPECLVALAAHPEIKSWLDG